MQTKDGRDLQRLTKDAKKKKCKLRIQKRYVMDKKNMDNYCNCTGSCDDKCDLMATKIECGKNCCPNGSCLNQVITNNQCVKELELFETEFKGVGVMAKKDIPESTYVMEYIGEIMLLEDYLERRRTKQKNSTHSYGLHITKDLVMDGFEYGNLGKYINHSCCEPNLEVQLWTVRGMRRVTFWTTKLIKENEELSYNYKFSNFNGSPFVCQCGGPGCVSKSKPNSNLNCEESSNSSVQVGQNEIHETDKERKPTFDCLVCKKFFHGKINLVQHLKKVHKLKWKLNLEDPINFICRECTPAVVFQTKSRLESHQFKHNEEKIWKCPMCDEVYYKQKKHLLEHQRAKHPKMF